MNSNIKNRYYRCNSDTDKENPSMSLYPYHCYICSICFWYCCSIPLMFNSGKSLCICNYSFYQINIELSLSIYFLFHLFCTLSCFTVPYLTSPYLVFLSALRVIFFSILMTGLEASQFTRGLRGTAFFPSRWAASGLISRRLHEMAIFRY